MNPLAIIALVNALMDLASKLVEDYQTQIGTPEEQAVALTALKTRLADTAAKVAAWVPKATP